MFFIQMIAPMPFERKIFLPFCCVFYVRQAIKTAARDLV